MLNENGVPLTKIDNPQSRDYFLTVTVDRRNWAPCIITSFPIGENSSKYHAKTYSLGLDKHIDDSVLSSMATDLNCEGHSLDTLKKIVSAMVEIFFTKEAYLLTIRLSRNEEGKLAVARSRFTFDDAAFRSGKRQGEIQKMGDLKERVPEELEAEKDGIVYIKSVSDSVQGDDGLANGFRS